MRKHDTVSYNADLVVSSLRAQMSFLSSTLNHIQDGNEINGYVMEGIKRVAKDLYWLRRAVLIDN